MAECKGCLKDEVPWMKKLMWVILLALLGNGIWSNNYGKAADAEKNNIRQEERIASLERVMEKLPETLSKINSTVNEIDRKIDVHIAQTGRGR